MDELPSNRKEPSAALDRLAAAVVDAAFEVYRRLGPGFLEGVYESALSTELELRGVTHECQVPVQINYKGRMAGEGRIDLLVGRSLVVELKAVDALAPVHLAQVLSYLRASKLDLGLLVNFNSVPFHHGIRRVIRRRVR